MRSWVHAEIALLELACSAVEFATNWLLQSTLLILLGLTTGRLLAHYGSAAQSLVYRTTLIAVLLCPAATWLLALTNLTDWSITMPTAWTYERVASPGLADLSSSAAPHQLAAPPNETRSITAPSEHDISPSSATAIPSQSLSTPAPVEPIRPYYHLAKSPLEPDADKRTSTVPAEPMSDGNPQPGHSIDRSRSESLSP
jgi:hypothetical protein